MISGDNAAGIVPLFDIVRKITGRTPLFVNFVEKDREIVTNRTTPAQYRKVGRRGTGKKRGQREKDRKERGRREIREREKENACTVREGGESNRLHSAGKLVRRGKGQNGIWRRWRGQEKRRRSAEIRTKARSKAEKRVKKLTNRGKGARKNFVRIQIYYKFITTFTSVLYIFPLQWKGRILKEKEKK